MSRVFVSPLATPFHSLVPIFPIPSRYISIFRAPPPRYFSPSLIHHFYLDGPVEPPRTTLGKERCETAPGLCRCCGQPFDFRHKRAALLLLGTHFAARAEAQAASVRRYRR